MDATCIYAAADLHGRESRFEIVARQAERPEIQALVLAGDMVSYGRGHAILERLAALPKPVFVVRGNTDPVRIENTIAATRRMHSLHLERRSYRRHQFVGVGGTLPIPFRSRIGWSETEILKRLAPMLTTRSILVVHPPPWGVRDRVAGRWHAGSRGLRRLIEATNPAVLICGHIHEAAGIEWLGRTLVVNCALGKRGRGAIISFDGRTTPTARMI
jgi:Icc-related predicted phosphoesterase